jgi:gamma-tubulin complex component 5
MAVDEISCMSSLEAQCLLSKDLSHIHDAIINFLDLCVHFADLQKSRKLIIASWICDRSLERRHCASKDDMQDWWADIMVHFADLQAAHLLGDEEQHMENPHTKKESENEFD